MAADTDSITFSNPDDIQLEEFEGLLQRHLRLAKLICDSSVAMVNWVGENEQKMLISDGLSVDTREENHKICQETIKGEDIKEISDLSVADGYKDSWYLHHKPPLVYYAGMPLLDSEGRRMGTFCVFDTKTKKLSEGQRGGLRDLAAEVADKLELFLDYRNLSYAGELKNELLRVVSHDLRNPIMGVVSASDMLLTDSDVDTEMVKEILEIIKNSGEQMYAVVSELLDNEIYAFGRVTLRPEPSDPKSLLEQVARLYEFYARTKNVTVSIKAEPGMPTLNLDKRAFFQIVGNLLSNAIKFSPRGEHIEVRMGFESVAENQGELLIEVQDSGIGIPPEVQSKLFEYDGKGREGTDGEPSYGLGLYIVNKLLEITDGSTNIDSTVDEGTTVQIILPAEINTNRSTDSRI